VGQGDSQSFCRTLAAPDWIGFRSGDHSYHRSYHTHPQSQRMWSHNLGFLSTRLHAAQHRIHMVTSFFSFRARNNASIVSSCHGQKMPARPTVLSVGAARELFRAVPPEPTSSFSGSSAECRIRLLSPWQPPSPELLNGHDLQDSKTSWQSSQSLWVASSFLETPSGFD